VPLWNWSMFCCIWPPPICCCCWCCWCKTGVNLRWSANSDDDDNKFCGCCCCCCSIYIQHHRHVHGTFLLYHVRWPKTAKNVLHSLASVRLPSVSVWQQVPQLTNQILTKVRTLRKKLGPLSTGNVFEDHPSLSAIQHLILSNGFSIVLEVNFYVDSLLKGFCQMFMLTNR